MLSFYSLEFHGCSIALLIAIFILSLFVSFPLSRLYYKGRIGRLNIKLHSLKYQKSKLEREIKTLTDRLQERDQEFNILKGELHNKEKLITNLKEHIAKFNNTINAQSRELHNLKQERQKKEKPALLGDNVAIDNSFFEGNHGNKEYWTANRLHFIKKIYPELSIRRLSELTGISKSTISDRLKTKL